jgi:IS30 family transposase
MTAQGPRQTTGGWERKDARNLNQQEKALIRKLKKAGYGRNAIAAKLGRGYATISRYLRSTDEDAPLVKTVYWTPEEDRRLIHLLNEGRSQVQIAEALGRSRGSVGVRLSVHRKATLSGTEIRYTKVNVTEPARPAPEPVMTDWSDAPEAIEPSPLGLQAEPDLFTLWNRLVFRGTAAA